MKLLALLLCLSLSACNWWNWGWQNKPVGQVETTLVEA